MSGEELETQLPIQKPIQINGIAVYPWNHPIVGGLPFQAVNTIEIGNAIALKTSQMSPGELLLAVDGANSVFANTIQGLNLAENSELNHLLRGMNGQVLAYMDFASEYGLHIKRRQQLFEAGGAALAAGATAIIASRKKPLQMTKRGCLIGGTAGVGALIGGLFVRNSLQRSQVELLPQGRENAILEFISHFGNDESADNVARTKLLLSKLTWLQESDIFRQAYPQLTDFNLALGTDHLDKKKQQEAKKAPKDGELVDLIMRREALFLLNSDLNVTEIHDRLLILSTDMLTSSFANISVDQTGMYSTVTTFANNQTFIFHPELAPDGLLKYSSADTLAEQFYNYIVDTIASAQQ